MAEDNRLDDEYQFADLDVMGSGLGEDENQFSEPRQSTSTTGVPQKKDIRRNALLVIIFIVILMLFYKFLGPFFSKKAVTDEIPQPTQPVVSIQPKPVEVVPEPQPVVQQSPDYDELRQKMSALEANQQNMQDEVSKFNNQLSTVSNSVGDLSNQVSKLNQSLTALTTQVSQQSLQINQWIAAQEEKKKKVVPVVRKVIAPHLLYFIQAVIPGRAWLIATNGTTLTVRAGSNVPGYGVVRRIDANQGRVIMSSGRVIKFSQQDS